MSASTGYSAWRGSVYLESTGSQFVALFDLGAAVGALIGPARWAGLSRPPKSFSAPFQRFQASMPGPSPRTGLPDTRDSAVLREGVRLMTAQIVRVMSAQGQPG